jgi:hypothetical protein
LLALFNVFFEGDRWSFHALPTAPSIDLTDASAFVSGQPYMVWLPPQKLHKGGATEEVGFCAVLSPPPNFKDFAASKKPQVSYDAI